MSEQHKEMANRIWDMADLLRHNLKDYSNYILPFTVLKRIDQVWESLDEGEHERIKNQHKKFKKKFEDPEIRSELLKQEVDGVNFYNTSDLTFSKLTDFPEKVKPNLMEYLRAYSPNIRDIFDKFEFESRVNKLADKGVLFELIKHFDKLDLHPNRVSNREMGLIFENLIRQFNQEKAQDRGEYFTPRDVVRLMTDLVLHGEEHRLEDEAYQPWVYDPACGTGGMLTEAERRINEINQKIDAQLYGQELEDETYAICKADMIIKDTSAKQADHIQLGNSLTEDKHRDKKFDYLLTNPPFGVKWSDYSTPIKDEEKEQGYNGRFGAGTPSTSDGQLLFFQHMIDHMQSPEEGGSRIAVVSNGSPLFTDEPSKSSTSNACSIRRWLLEEDCIDTIVQIPEELFYNTKITTYIWILDNDKPEERQGKVRLIDASDEQFFEMLSSNIGDKRCRLGTSGIERVDELYGVDEKQISDGDDSKGEPVSTDHVQVFDREELGYRKVEIKRPHRKFFRVDEAGVEALKDERVFGNRDEAKQHAILSALAVLEDEEYDTYQSFKEALDAELANTDYEISRKSTEKALIRSLGVDDEEADIVMLRGEKLEDKDKSDYEYIPLTDDVEQYFEEEVKPYWPDAWINRDLTDEQDGGIGKVGYEINFNKFFYEYEPPRDLSEINTDIQNIEREIRKMTQGLAGEKNEDG